MQHIQVGNTQMICACTSVHSRLLSSIGVAEKERRGEKTKDRERKLQVECFMKKSGGARLRGLGNQLDAA